MFASVLVANRGEIAARVIRTLHRMGVESVAVYSDPDADGPWVASADRSVRLGPAPAHASYLSIERVIAAAVDSGAQAVHPGYGFLSENPAFARACAEAGLAFIGPPATVIERMGDKIAAKQTAIAAGVPVVPGCHDADMDDHALAEAALRVGFPVLIKPAAGGGGKGMRIVRSESDIEAAVASARRESRSSFGDDTLFIERLVTRPRHIEVQVLGDTHGAVVHLGERECSLQRRHQKVIEEAPSPLLDDETRMSLCASAVRLAESVGYVGAGTVEYVVPGDDPGAFAFLEMNTRLQVEHPVTEEVTGIDLVEWQVRIAAGEPLGFTQSDIRTVGHAVEARVYAEDPDRDFLPTGGLIAAWRTADGVRTDAGIAQGVTIGSDYDPLLAKVIAWAPDRPTALAGLASALADTVALGVVTNIDYLRDLLVDDRVVAGDLDTGLIEAFERPTRDSGEALLLAALATLPPASDDPWCAGDAWRLGGIAPMHLWLDDMPVSLVVAGDGAIVEVDGRQHSLRRELPVDAIAAVLPDGIWLHSPTLGHRRVRCERRIDRSLRSTSVRQASGAWVARSPMPGLVISVEVAAGDSVAAGDVLVVVEAMKMEHALRSPTAGRVSSVAVATGDRVRLDDSLVHVELEVMP